MPDQPAIQLTDEQVRILGTTIGESLGKALVYYVEGEISNGRGRSPVRGECTDAGWVLTKLGEAIGTAMKS